MIIEATELSGATLKERNKDLLFTEPLPFIQTNKRKFSIKSFQKALQSDDIVMVLPDKEQNAIYLLSKTYSWMGKFAFETLEHLDINTYIKEQPTIMSMPKFQVDDLRRIFSIPYLQIAKTDNVFHPISLSTFVPYIFTVINLRIMEQIDSNVLFVLPIDELLTINELFPFYYADTFEIGVYTAGGADTTVKLILLTPENHQNIRLTSAEFIIQLDTVYNSTPFKKEFNRIFRPNMVERE